jgi:L-cysteine desulfidase
MVNVPTNPEILSITPAVREGAAVLGASRLEMGHLAQGVSQNALPVAAPTAGLLGTAASLAGGLLTGAIIWKGIKVMASATAPEIFGSNRS